MLDTDQLRSFLAIVDTGSFTRAAERVSKTQSAVSMHMRRLEEQLGCELFLRQGRGVRLSSEGERLVDFARRMLQIEATALASLANKGLAGRVRLGMPDDYTEPFLADILTAFSRRHPLVEVAVVCESSQTLARRIEASDLDLAVVTDCGDISGIEIVREEPLVWVAGAHLQVDITRPLPLAVGNSICNWREMAIQALQGAGLSYRMLMVSNNYAAIRPIVRAGLALTVLPLGSVDSTLRVVGESEGLPPLAFSCMGIVMAPSRASPETLALAQDIRVATSLTRPGEGKAKPKLLRSMQLA